jgi:hypothetical protein
MTRGARRGPRAPGPLAPRRPGGPRRQARGLPGRRYWAPDAGGHDGGPRPGGRRARLVRPRPPRRLDLPDVRRHGLVGDVRFPHDAPGPAVRAMRRGRACTVRPAGGTGVTIAGPQEIQTDETIQAHPPRELMATPTYTVTLRPLPPRPGDDPDPGATRALRRLLKYAGRVCRLKCVRVESEDEHKSPEVTR